jgi:hypothetical protein
MKRMVAMPQKTYEDMQIGTKPKPKDGKRL